ncbi:PREDICTED: cytochrome P450 71B17-like [Camelina sativa]|uniref:Cytochrome P450 71B17-like n=1 Tax=Camelina sativa TaxID=90675 RepID=A0ABM0TSU4_CAMSA|nr:PREDICTED: cytochrome P450 71B17-like [Camelina sativa]
MFRDAFGKRFHECEFIDKDKVKELVSEAESAQGSFTCSEFFPIVGLGWLVDCISRKHMRLKDVFFKLDTMFQGVIDYYLHPGKISKDHRDIVDVMLDVIQFVSRRSRIGAITMIGAKTKLVITLKVMKKVQGEIQDRLGNNKERITEEDLDKVPFLNMVINETLRLDAAAPLLLPRETMAHIKVQGYDIPPKTQILVNTWAIGRHPKYWTNPEEFNPERFMDSPVDYKG